MGRWMIRTHPLPEHQDKKKKKYIPEIEKVNIDGKLYDVPTSFNFGTTYCGDLKTLNEQEVSHYLKLVIDAGCANEAHGVIETMGQYSQRTGFATIERLADVYGRRSGNIATLPTEFPWAQKNLHLDWSEYKLQIITHNYLELHAGCEQLVVACAKRGFDKYQDSHRLLDYIRTTLGDEPSWSKLVETVDRFLGDSHRQIFERNVLYNNVGTSKTNAVLSSEDIYHVNKVGFEFLPKDKGKKKNRI